MSNYKRHYLPGSMVFFTVCSHQRRPIFTDELFRSSLRKSIVATRLSFKFEVSAWVLLPDHLHCIWRLPRNVSDYSSPWSMIKRLVSKDLGAHYGVDGEDSSSRFFRAESSIWQRRFWVHHIANEQSYKHHLDYCYWNPVKHGLVNAVKDWRFSTFHRDVRKGLYDEGWCSYIDDSDSSKYGE